MKKKTELLFLTTRKNKTITDYLRQCSVFYLESSWWLVQLCVVQRQDEDSWMKNKVAKYDAQIKSYESREVKWCEHCSRWIARGTYAYLYRDKIVPTYLVIACAVCVQFVRRNSLVQNRQVSISIIIHFFFFQRFLFCLFCINFEMKSFK